MAYRGRKHKRRYKRASERYRRRAGGGVSRKYQTGGRTSCPPGTHMMPDGSCMQGAYHGAPNRGRGASSPGEQNSLMPGQKTNLTRNVNCQSNPGHPLCKKVQQNHNLMEICTACWPLLNCCFDDVLTA